MDRNARYRRRLIGVVLGGLILVMSGVLGWHTFVRTSPPKGSIRVVDEQLIAVMQGMLEAWKGTSQHLSK